MKNIFIYGIVVLSLGLAGCGGLRKGNDGNMMLYAVPREEAAWIRDGEPIEFEDQLWYPQDGFDILTDSELIKVGRYRGVEFFVSKADVRPFYRLYTKFDRNKFRYFEQRPPS